MPSGLDQSISTCSDEKSTSQQRSLRSERTSKPSAEQYSNDRHDRFESAKYQPNFEPGLRLDPGHPDADCGCKVSQADRKSDEEYLKHDENLGDEILVFSPTVTSAWSTRGRVMPVLRI